MRPDAFSVPPPPPGSRTEGSAALERSLQQGDETFGEHTDNITQLVVYLNPAGDLHPPAAAALPPPPPASAAAEKRAAAAPSCFSV